MKLTRREHLAVLGAAAATPWLTSAQAAAPQPNRLISTNTYPWLTFARRAGATFHIHSDELLAEIAESGIRGYEPIINSPSEFEGLGDRLKRHGLTMRSLYVNSTLHDQATVEKSIASVLAIGKAARALGVSIIVTNPSPIRWGGPDDKSDAQLELQAKSLDRLGAALRKLGIALAYHNHDAELRNGAREFHHMLTVTNPDNVKFCLDAHWLFRGCGNSQVALFDAVRHYCDRIVEVHLRQSVDGVWTEAFAMQGDIDYRRLFVLLAERGLTPHLVIEQAVESGSTNKLDAVAAHAKGLADLTAALK